MGLTKAHCDGQGIRTIEYLMEFLARFKGGTLARSLAHWVIELHEA
jgi:hypothetical protein